MRIPFLPFLLAVAVSAVAVPAAEEWSRFRGPDGAGIGDAPNLPVKWTAADLNWKVELPGTGHASPVAWGPKLFVVCGNKQTAQRTVLCLRASDGGMLWRKDYDSRTHAMNNLNSYGTATPAVDAERVYVTWTTPAQVILAALSHDGKEVWRRDDLGAFESQHGSGTSPIVWEDLVILGNDTEGKESFLIALEAKTGKTAWKHPRQATRASYSTPCLYRPADGPPQVVFSGKDHGLTALDPRTGKLIWELNKVFPLRVVGSPTVAAGLIVGTCGEGGRGHVFAAVRPGTREKPEDAKVAYTLTKSVPYVPTPVAVKGLLFLWSENGTVQCMKAATGEVLWSERVGGSFYASPICVSGRLYNVSQTGEAVVLAASEKYELLGRSPLGEGSYATPAVAGGRLIIRTFTHLLSLGR